MAFISLFPNATTPTPVGELQIRDALQKIKAGQWKSAVENVRANLDDTEAYLEAKKKLPGLTFSGRFDHRKASDPGFRHSRVILCDIDKLNGDLPAIRKAIEADPHTAFNFISPSGNGLKPGVVFKGRLETTEQHKACFEFLQSYFRDQFGVELDSSCSDVSRLCFVSYDPDLYRNEHAVAFNVPKIKPAPKNLPGNMITPSEFGQKALETAVAKVALSPPGHQHETRLKMARLLGGYVGGGMLTEAEAEARMEAAVVASGAKDLKAAMKTVRDGLKYGIAAPMSLEALERERKEWVKNNHLPHKQTEEKFQSGASLSQLSQLSQLSPDEPKFHFALAQIDEKLRNDTLSRIYKRCGWSDSVSPEEAISMLQRNEPLAFEREKCAQVPEFIDNTTEKLLYELFLRDLVTFVAGVTGCHRLVTGLSPESPKAAVAAGSKEFVEAFVADSSGWFATKDVYEAVGAFNATEKNTTRANLLRLIKDGVIERHKSVNGKYRRIDTEAPRMDFMSECDTSGCDMNLPFHLNDHVEIMPGNIIIVAGSPNAGKTAICLNIAFWNLRKFKTVRYLNSEMGVAELRKRMLLFDEMPLKFWADNGFDPRERPQGNFQDALATGEGNLNIIDYLEVHEEFYAVGGMIRAIHEKLDGAICVIAIQKDKGTDYGRGGLFTLEKPRLALAVDYINDGRNQYNTVKIAKAKNFKGDQNPNGMVMNFKLVGGAKIIPTTTWSKK